MTKRYETGICGNTEKGSNRLGGKLIKEETEAKK
jgi:hypothetical protein